MSATRPDVSATVPPGELTVIVPTLNEADAIACTLRAIQQQLPHAALVVADGDSSDRTVALASAVGAQVIASSRGRGLQCRAGAELVSSEWMLFLHADTVLPAEAGRTVARFIARPEARIATFRLRFDTPSWFLRVCGWCTRIDSVFTRFGDQGILVRTSLYRALGGFPPWPLFEDVAFLQQARRVTRVHSLPACVTTSARRFRQHGAVRQQWLNARLLLRYLSGESPQSLARAYRAEATSLATRRTPPLSLRET